MQSSECTLWRGLVSGFLVDVVSNDMLSPIIETRAHRSTASFEWFLCASSDSSDRYSRAEVRKQRTQRSTPHVLTVLYTTVFTFTTTMSCVWECCRIAWNKINSLSQTTLYDQILTLPPHNVLSDYCHLSVQTLICSYCLLVQYWQQMAWQSYTRCVAIFSIWVK